MRVIKDRLLVETTPAAERSAGGLFLAGRADQSQVVLGKVIDVGSTVEDVTVGNGVYFNKFTAFKVTKNGKDFFSIKEADVIAIED
jgi:co-chaperonin GroES (HSP10)